MLLASTSAALSWSDIPQSHWSGPALLYSGIVFSLTAFLLGNQQTLVLPDQVHISTEAARDLRNRLSHSRGSSNPEPRSVMLFLWQTPVMCLTYSALCFLGGTTSIVLSDFAQNMSWGDGAKVSRRLHFRDDHYECDSR